MMMWIIGVACILLNTAVSCPTQGDIRLVDGDNNVTGRVQICNNNSWGEVCSNSWGVADANIACRQLGFASQGALPLLGFEEVGYNSSAIIWLDDVQCTGTETRLIDCPASPLGNHSCDPFHTAGVECREALDPPTMVQCTSGMSCDGAVENVTLEECCNRTALSGLSFIVPGMEGCLECPSFCTQGDIRLLDGANISIGRVEICNNNIWGTVCGGTSSWTATEASVACRQLGFLPEGAEHLLSSFTASFGRGRGQIWLDDVQCSGNETKLIDCPASPLGVHECVHASDSGARCRGLVTIGFNMPQYEFIEPEEEMLVNLTLIKEVDLRTEQTFSVLITIGDPNNVSANPAALGSDFSPSEDPFLNSTWRIIFTPDVQTVEFTVFLNPDNLLEGTEAFQVNLAPEAMFPPFVLDPFGTTVIIRDSDFAMVGFEQDSYTVRETDGQREVCVILTDPSSEEELLFDIDIVLTFETRTGSADVNDSRPIEGEIEFDSDTSVRKKCFNVSIINDVIFEEVESFTIDLELKPGQPSLQSGVKVQPNETEIFIIDVEMLCSPTRDCNESLRQVVLTVEECCEQIGLSYTTTENRSNCIECPRAPVTQNSATSPLALGIGISLAVLVAVVALLTVMLVIICCKIRSRRMWKGENLGQAKAMVQFNNPGSQTWLLEPIKQSIIESGIGDLIIPFSSLRMLDVVGQGEFSIVYKAHLTVTDTMQNVRMQHNSAQNPLPVAVKVQKDINDIKQAVQECKWMKMFDHPNVLSFLGICIDAGPVPYVVLPFMANGSLRCYLRNNNTDLIATELSTEEDEINTKRRRLLDMCYQICKGMECLAEEMVIHRDLAARNCMIDDTWTIKVADFGLTRETGNKDYFRQCKDESVKLPIKWMALESLEDCIFSEKSDVWSFGVTMWEVFTGGSNPYKDTNPLTLAGKLRSGERLQKPENLACNDEIYSVMLDCWLMDPQDRPCFKELSKKFNQLIQSMNDYLEIVTFQ